MPCFVLANKAYYDAKYVLANKAYYDAKYENNENLKKIAQNCDDIKIMKRLINNLETQIMTHKIKNVLFKCFEKCHTVK